MRGLVQFRLAGALVAGALRAALAVPARGAGQLFALRRERGGGARPATSATLASDPKDFDSLIGAGRAALALGDAQAAAGFFARADEVNPRSPLPQAGMGAVSVANGDPQAALPYFKRAQQLGASRRELRLRSRPRLRPAGPAGAGAGRLSARAVSGRDRDEARRRLALSLAISGDRGAALADARAAIGQGRSGHAPGSAPSSSR